MRDLLAAAWVIARRDYVATVLSKAFILFLIAPVLPILFSAIFAFASAQGDTREPVAPVVAITDAPTGALLQAARDRLGAPEALTIRAPTRDEDAQVRALLAGGVGAVMTGGLDRPALTGSPEAIDQTADDVGALVDQAREARALERVGGPPPQIAVARHPIAAPATAKRSDHRDIARAGQFVLVLLTMLLAGMVLSNLLDEKANKVIDILVSAVPVGAIFLGKLAAMLAMSLSFIAVWGALSALGAALAVHAGMLPPGLGIAPPAVGWPAFVILGVAYFAMSYLLLGAVFLGIGAQARSAREVQTLAMPVTMGQLIVFGFASAGIGAPDGRAAWAATIFPWSSPFAMFARAAQLPALWPHLIGLAWQALWVGLAIRLSARLFRRSVLNAAPLTGRAGR